MNFLPIFLKLAGQQCLVVGGGEVAARKVATLLKAGGAVTVLAPALGAALAPLAADRRIAHLAKVFEPADLAGFQLVISATDHREVNEQVHAAATRRNLPVNVVDCPELCSFIFPAIVDRSPVVIAVSTGGASPVLARLIRAKLESALPPAYGRLADLAEKFRQGVKQAVHEPHRRRHFWERALGGVVADLMFAGREAEAERHLGNLLETERLGHADTGGGFVSLVGAGPGDPDLLTLGALRAMQEADVVVYDRLVSPEVMALVRNDAEKIYAGKESSRHTLPQDQINALLARLAKQGRRVVRLKGGDPFIFGRGGEEIETLMEEGIPFQVIPGITAASGCAAYAGIPLTHRDHAQAVTFVTGHLKQGGIGELDWERLARPGQTLVIYMGLQGLPQIRAALIGHGCAPDTPAALVQQGTTRHQRVITGTVDNLPGLVADAGVSAPTLVIVGGVVGLHGKLAWFQGADTGNHPPQAI
ncbi:siroheme synthase CysG [Methylomagnum ishizawai]|uniref:siroheme synthase CysG n=1 Tax=Methylomagnum ishizawai TaxID=1760988 RepID=UPI001C339516|nr:siroheme synthase CysG [Methylomagnum ishizawai]BBL74331.1 siroheme synthase [Methylomagnum ishizawai]